MHKATSLADLRRRREALGLSLPEVSEALRIPVDHLQALEDERPEALPEGPYGAGFLRAYCAHLDVDPGPLLAQLRRADVAEVPRGAEVPTWAVRGLAGVACVGMIGMLAWQLVPSRPDPHADTEGGPAPIEAPQPDQRVRVRVQQGGMLRILVDGEQVLDRRVRPGEDIEVAGHHRVEVIVPAAEMVRVEYNGEAVIPQGRQDAPRRLVFVDDLEE